MTIEIAQKWMSLIGLLVDFYGVLLLTKEWAFIFGRGLRGFVEKAGRRHQRVAQRLQNKFLTAKERRDSQKYKWLLWCNDLEISALKLRSRNEARHMTSNGPKFNAPVINLLDGNGILCPSSVEVYSGYLYQFVDDLVENGEARDQSVKGLKWVLLGLCLQILGNIPFLS